MNIPRMGMGTLGTADYRCMRYDDNNTVDTGVDQDWTGCPGGEIWNERRAGNSGAVANQPRYGVAGMGDAAYDKLFAAYAANRVPPDVFLEHFGGEEMGGPYEPPDPEVCLKIQCGAITQAQAGQKVLFACANSNFTGVRSCADPLCAPYCGNTASTVARAAQPLPVAPRVEQMFVTGPKRGCNPVYWGPKFGGPYSEQAPCGGRCEPAAGAEDFINAHPLFSVLALAGAAYGVYHWRKGRG
jgi:hypothetical protein